MGYTWKQLPNIQSIDCNEEFMVLESRSFFSCRKDGTNIVRYPEIHAPCKKMVFLPNHHLLVDGGTERMYHLISLNEGKVIRSVKVPGNRRNIANNFCVSSDGQVAYDFWTLNNQKYILKIDTNTLEYITYPLNSELRSVRNLVYISEDNLLVLQTQVDSEGSKSWCVNMLSNLRLTSSGPILFRLYRWNSPSEHAVKITDGRYVLYNSLRVFDLKTSNTLNLLQDTKIPLRFEYNFYSHKYYDERGLLQLYDGKQTYFVDCKSRKVVAHYNNEPGFYQGCISGEQFFMADKNRIIVKPFPYFVDAP